MFARTSRLTLRPGWPEDAAALTAAIAHEAVASKLARLPWPYTQAHAEAWLARPAGVDEYPLLIFAHDAGPAPALIGGIGLHPGDSEHSSDGLQIAYWLTPAAWGRGYATEAGRQMVDIARHSFGLRRLTAYHHADNPASGRVLRTLGFHEIGGGARYSLARSAPVDSVHYALDLEDDKPLALAA